MDNNNAQPYPESDNNEDVNLSEAQEINWVVVEQTMGITVAEIIAGRLQAEGIPARAWQEGAGEALGLIGSPRPRATSWMPTRRRWKKKSE